MSDQFLMNRLANAGNPFQGKHKKVLCVCSAGLLRSPTAAYVLSQEPYNYNTRASGLTPEFALVPVDRVLLHWADFVVCMDERQGEQLRYMLREFDEDKPVFVLGIPDVYGYRDPDLIAEIKTACDQMIAGGGFEK